MHQPRLLKSGILNVRFGQVGAVVTKEIKEPGIYAGNPARFLKALPDGYSRP
ncbi:MAG: hypothetical protein J5J00_09970 [Deltaproteobacteria bacterium]|nr:hypothetical protein [Deltaproteobacteria bacterium]